MSTTATLAPVIEQVRLLLSRVDDPVALTFLDVIDSATDESNLLEPAPFPLGDYPGLEVCGCETTLPLLRAIAHAASSISWYQSDSNRVPPGWVERSAATQLIGPDGGLFSPDQSRLGLFYLSPGLNYPDHWHDPDEFYLVLAGSATFTIGGHVAVNSPGDFSVTPSGAVHSIRTAEEPMLALWGWAGEDTSFDSYSY